MTTVDFLPEGCISNVVSLTSPRDACRLSLVASRFKSVADSDAVWERFLPFDYKDIITGAVDHFPSLMPSISKKQLYLWLSDHPLLIDHGTKSFSLEKSSGRKCYMLSACDLTIVWSDTARYWKWISIPESRFPEVAELINVWWLEIEIRGKIKTSMLSPNTTYAAFLVFKPTAGVYGFINPPAEVAVGISGGESETRTVYLDPEEGQRQPYPSVSRRSGLFTRAWRPHVSSPLKKASNGKCPKVRGDAWMEIELGEYFNDSDGGEDRELEMSLMKVTGGNWKSGLIVEGIEIRPKVVEE